MEIHAKLAQATLHAVLAQPDYCFKPMVLALKNALMELSYRMDHAKNATLPALNVVMHLLINVLHVLLDS